MVDDEIGRKARLLIKNNKIKKISENLWEVDGETVQKITRPGRSFFTCTCKSYVMFCGENPRCLHKECTIIFNEKIQKRINKSIELYENCEKINMKPENEVIIQELKDLKYFI